MSVYYVTKGTSTKALRNVIFVSQTDVPLTLLKCVTSVHPSSPPGTRDCLGRMSQGDSHALANSSQETQLSLHNGICEQSLGHHKGGPASKSIIREHASLTYIRQSGLNTLYGGLKTAQVVKRINKSILLPAHRVEPLESIVSITFSSETSKGKCGLLLLRLGGNDFQVAKQHHNVKGPSICDL